MTDPGIGTTSSDEPILKYVDLSSVHVGKATKLVQYDKVDVIFGGIFSSTRQAIKSAAVAKGKVRVVSILKGKRPAIYPIALTAASRHDGPGKKFIEFVLGKGEASLLKYGFMRPQ